MKKIVTFFILNSIAGLCYGQAPVNRCGTDALIQQTLVNYPSYKANREKIEAFTENYLKNLPTSKKERGTIYYIPVVVHIIHNGEAVGSGNNISVAQINSQITALNLDYRKLNPDWNNTPTAFKSVVADAEIQFGLATKDESGNYTTGITRHNQGKSSYDEIDMIAIKTATIWDNSKYLNIWVANFGGSASGLLGYATPPGGPWDQDGVVIRTKSFGTTGNVVSPYHKGRTATHEIGHYFNLLHIWGNTSCGTDYVSDTPISEQANYGCPTFPHNAGSTCGSNSNGEMYMNYMDYVDDLCMMMFTAGQINRMRSTLVSGGSRSSLTTSNGLQWPTNVSDLSNNLSVSIYPNPVSNSFSIEGSNSFGNDFAVHIYNAIGQDLSAMISVSKESASQYQINTNGLANGTYFVKINSNNQQSTKSITILK